MRWNVPHDGDWHRWFAWYPVRCVETNILVWMEVVDRRFYNTYPGSMLMAEHRIKEEK